MNKKYNPGDIVYFVSNSIFVKKATVIRCAGGFVTIKFDESNTHEGPSGTRVRLSRIYDTEEEANKVIQEHLSLHERLSH